MYTTKTVIEAGFKDLKNILSRPVALLIYFILCPFYSTVNSLSEGSSIFFFRCVYKGLVSMAKNYNCLKKQREHP